MTLHVIGAGFGRTGTASLKAALEILYGGTCYHMYEVLGRTRDIPVWRDVALGSPPDWHAFLDGFVAAVDWPAARYYRELAAAFPDAKVVLTVRDPERWYDSVAETIFPMTWVNAEPPVRWAVDLHPHARQFVEMSDRVIWGETGHFGGRFPDRAHALAVYRAHVDEVRAAIPPDRLLEMRVADGWEPLCAFLDLPVPDVPFPNVNDRDEMLRRMKWMKRLGWAAAPVTWPLYQLRRQLAPEARAR